MGRQDRRQMQCHRFAKCAGFKLKYCLDIRFTTCKTGRNSIANRTTDHIDVGNTVDNLLDTAERCAMHDNRETGLFAQSSPTVYIILHERVFDIADDGVIAFQFLDYGEDRCQTPVTVEIVVDLKALWCDLFGEPSLFYHVVVIAGVHLKDGISLIRRATDFVTECLRCCRTGPRCNRHRISHFLSD